MEWNYAFVGEKTGGILTYSGWISADGQTPEIMKIDIAQDGTGIVNTNVKEISGQTNHLNNYLYTAEDCFTMILGDGTVRNYEKVNQLPQLILGEEIIPTIAAKVCEPQYWRLRAEGFRVEISYISLMTTQVILQPSK